MMGQIFFIWLLVQSSISFGQNIEKSAKYISQIDEEITVNRVVVLSPVDNMGGIYGRPIKKHLQSLVEKNHQWALVEMQFESLHYSPEELEENPNLVTRLNSEIPVDGFLSSRISKGPKGIFIKLDLFLANDGQLFAQEILRNHPRFEIREVLHQISGLYKKLVKKIPYSGIILSRRANKVTLSLGSANGLKKNEMVSAIQIIGIKRHPKFHFLVSTEKEILGRIKVLKVEETLSFGAIVYEKERGVLRKGTKLSNLEFIEYDDSDNISPGKTTAGALGSRTDAHTSFGDNPKEWVPQRTPTFGKVGVQLGFGSYGGNMSFETESLSAKSSFYPTMTLEGELWMTSHWIVRATIHQGVITVRNPRSGSLPSSLSLALNAYSLRFGYNFLLTQEFFGPKIILLGGYSMYSLFVDNTNPTVLTTMEYNGFDIGVRGSVPLTEKNIWRFGAEFNMNLGPAMKESPVVSGSSSRNTINRFSFFGSYKMNERMRVSGSLDFQLYSSTFSGAGTRTDGQSAQNASQKHTTLNGGIYYLF